MQCPQCGYSVTICLYARHGKWFLYRVKNEVEVKVPKLLLNSLLNQLISLFWFFQSHLMHHFSPLTYICSSQPSMVHWLSSPIFPFCSFVCRPAMVTSYQISTSTSPRPPNPYIFWKLMIIAIQKWIRNTITKTKTISKTMTKTKTPRE